MDIKVEGMIKMTSRERVLKALKHEEADRVPIHDVPWSAAVTRWRKEGLPPEIPVNEYFEFEFVDVGFDSTPRFPVKIIEKNQDYILEQTATGGINRNYRDHSTTPEVVDRPIKKKEDWAPIKKRLYPDYTRVDWVTLSNTISKAESEGKFTTIGSAYGYDGLQSYIKSDSLLMAMAEDPDWVKDMVMTGARLFIDMAKMIFDKGIKVDACFMYNDMGYRNALLFSPETYRKTHKEADEMVISFFHERNMPVILHSCGRVKEMIPELISIGLDCLQPLEVKAGMDLVELKKEFGNELSFMGGIDVRVMASGDRNLIEDEVGKKISFAKKNGGYIYHSDHSVPKNVSFESYKFVIECVKKYGKY